MDVTRFLDALEIYVDSRIALDKTDPDAQTRNSRGYRDEAENRANYARSDLIDELRDLLK